MEIKTAVANIEQTANIANATVLMKSGDHLSVGYIDPRGKFHSINISALQLGLLVGRARSEAAMIIRPSTGVQFVPGIK